MIARARASISAALFILVATAGCGDGGKAGGSASASAPAGPTSTMPPPSKTSGPPSAPGPSASAPSAARPGETPEALFVALREVVDILDNAEDCPKMKAAIDSYRTRYPDGALEGMAKRLIMEPDDPGPKRRGNSERLEAFKAAHPAEVGELKARHEAQKKRFASLHEECAELETIMGDVGVMLSIAGK